MNRLLEKYNKEVKPELMKKFNYKSVSVIPKIKRVVVNSGVGKLDDKPKERVMNDLALITGQKPAKRGAKKSIAGFKLRKGMEVGFIVTLQGKRMYDFLDRLVSIAWPRTRDFRGLEIKSIQNSSMNVGIKEQNVFPEIEFESTKDLFGFQVTINTTSKTKEESLELFRLLGFPIKKQKNG